ncbi:hypothetical protein LDENG_00168900 [Lucifuga dentata]|nr:hypothetical protein LDENG_00168900 [Lucifuga dentata]
MDSALFDTNQATSLTGNCRGNFRTANNNHKRSPAELVPVSSLADGVKSITMSHRLTKKELDEQFQQFLNESLSDDSVDLDDTQKEPGDVAKRDQKSAQKAAVSTAPWYHDDDHDDRGAERGLLGSGKTFRKSLRKSQPLEEKDEADPGDDTLKEERMKMATFSIKADVTCSPAVKLTSLGVDTLEEEEEKAWFFAQMEAEASSIDYSKLNRELDSTSSTFATSLRKPEGEVEQSDDDQSKAKVAETDRNSPVFTGSLHHSEDFEEEESRKEPMKEKSKMSAILAKVSLDDSLEVAGGEDERTGAMESQDKGQSYVQSGGSEMEAVHEAYRQISHAVDDSDDRDRCRLSPGGRWRSSQPTSPPSPPPQHAAQSLHLASTTESELPTAEELMKPIRPEKDDDVRGFTLQPVSVLHLDQGKTSWSWERDSPESNPKQPGNTRPVVEIKGARKPSKRQSISPEPPICDVTRSIREEVERLMQHQDEGAAATLTSKAKKQQVACGSTPTHRPTSLVKKPTVAHVRGRSSGPSRAAAITAKSVSRDLKSPRKDDRKHTEPMVKVGSEVVGSVQSFVSVHQQQLDTSSFPNATESQEIQEPQEPRPTQRLPKENRDESGSLLDELRVQLVRKEKELQLMQHQAEELDSLKQQNFVLQSKLRSAEEKKRKRMEASDPEIDEKLQLMNKEIQEQEILIKGYQQENEKLYLQMKHQQAKSKETEKAMFNENQRLLNELAVTREQFKTSTHMGSMDHATRITELLAHINTLQRNEARLSEEIHKLKQQNQALHKELQRMKDEREARAASISENQASGMREREETHRKEVAALKKKLQQFAANSELLDRDSSRLKAATAEIRRLKEQVQKLKMDVGRRDGKQQKKSKVSAVDTRRMQDLEQQVKKLEHILRSRNPNSLPALMFAAAAAEHQADLNAASTPSPSVNEALERRIQRLEAELESRDEEAKLRLRTMEQQFHTMKLRYEQQILELEQQLVEAGSSVAENVPRVQTLQEELQRQTEINQSKERSLQDQIQTLQQQLQQAEIQCEDELSRELAAKTQRVEELSRTVERLQTERRSLLSGSSSRQQSRTGEANQQPAPQEGGARGETFPATQEKAYQPTVFTGSHITDVLQENEALRQRLDLLQRRSEQEEETSRAEVLRTKDELHRLKETFAEQLSSMKAEHLEALDCLQASHALEHSSSKVAELKNELSAQEIRVKQLQEQLKQQHETKNALAISRTREDALQNQLTRLLKELKDAKDAQNPEVKLVCSLEKKILNMELRHQQREKELQQVIGGSRQLLEADQLDQVDHWRRLAQEKSRELEAFRLELDSILDILRHLHGQGFVLPSHKS